MSFRDILKDRGVLPDEEDEVVIGQKVVTPEGIGIVTCVGTRFVTVSWAGAKKERIARSKLRSLLKTGEATVLPTFLRTARYGNDVSKL